MLTEEQIEKINQMHSYFSTDCFNKAWDLIEKSDKTEKDLEEMINLCHASFWHWTQVPDVKPLNLSVGYWQLSRVYSIAIDGENALKYGNRCLNIGTENNLEPFYTAYAYEAIARAYKVMNQIEQAEKYKIIASEFTEKVTNEDYKKLLQDDLKTI
jgi:hypothetical protein